MNFSLVEQIHDQDHVNIDSFAMKELIDLTNYAAAKQMKIVLYLLVPSLKLKKTK